MERERNRELSGVDQLLELRGAACAADEIDSLVRADVTDAEDRREHGLLQPADIESLGRTQIRRRDTQPYRVPLAIEIHRHLALPRRRRSFASSGYGGQLLHLEPLAQFREQ